METRRAVPTAFAVAFITIGIAAGCSPAPPDDRMADAAMQVSPTDLAAPPDLAPEPDLAPDLTVRGGGSLTYFSLAGAVTQPIDYGAQTVAALVPSGSSFDTYNGTGTSMGTFEIPHVPLGTYYLQLGSRYWITDSRAPMLGDRALGRAAAAPITNPATALDFALTGLDSWQPTDVIQYFSLNAGTLYANLTGNGSMAPAFGDTSFTGTVTAGPFIADNTLATVAPSQPNLLDPAMGDTGIATQLGSASSDTQVIYQAVIASSAATPAAAQVDGASLPVTAALAKVAQTHSADFVFRRTTFDIARADLNPNAGNNFYSLAILAQPGAMGALGYSPTPALLLLTPDGTVSDIDFGTLKWADPYPTDWTSFVVATEGVEVALATAHSLPINATGRISVTGSVADLSGAPITMLMGPAQTPTINGISVFQANSAVTVSPTIAWAVPRVGSGPEYTLIIWQLAAVAGSTTYSEVARFYTFGTSVTLPPSILMPRTSYFLTLSACGPATGTDPTNDVPQYPRGCADLVSEQFTP